MMTDMDWKRKRVQNRQKISDAREEGSIGLLLFLMVIGGFLFAGNTVMSQMGRMTNSLRRNLARAASEKENPLQKAGKMINQNNEFAGKVCDVTLKDDDRENG